MMTQSAAIAAHLERGESITALDALRLYGCLRLAARIKELRRAGILIYAQMITLPNGKRIARYAMEGEDG